MVDTALSKSKCLQLLYSLKCGVFFIIKRGIDWWENALLLVGNFEGLMWKIPISLLVKKCPERGSRKKFKSCFFHHPTLLYEKLAHQSTTEILCVWYSNEITNDMHFLSCWDQLWPLEVNFFFYSPLQWCCHSEQALQLYLWQACSNMSLS